MQLWRPCSTSAGPSKQHITCMQHSALPLYLPGLCSSCNLNNSVVALEVKWRVKFWTSQRALIFQTAFIVFHRNGHSLQPRGRTPRHYSTRNDIINYATETQSHDSTRADSGSTLMIPQIINNSTAFIFTQQYLQVNNYNSERCFLGWMSWSFLCCDLIKFIVRLIHISRHYTTLNQY